MTANPLALKGSLWHRIAYTCIFAAMLAGLATGPIKVSEVWPYARPYVMLCGALLMLVLAAKALRFNPLLTLVSVFLLLSAQFMSVSSILATALFFLTAALVGSRLMRWLGTQDLLVSTLVGVFLLTGVVGWLLQFHVHSRVVYLVAVATVIWIERRPARELLASLPANATRALNTSPKTAGIALVVAFASLTTAWLPSMQFDDMGYHAMLVSQLLNLGYYRFDLSTQVWAAAPWGSDLVHAVVAVLANDESRGSINLAWFVFSCCALWRLGERLGLKPQFRWLAIALYASQPYISSLFSSAHVENQLVAATLVLALVTLQVLRNEGPHAGPVMLLLCGLFANLKASQALVVAPFFVACIPGIVKSPPRKLIIVGIAALLLAASSYAYSWFLSGSPMTPLFNAFFKSPFYPPFNFNDARWAQGINWRSIWDLTFSTEKYQENYAGGAGVSVLVLSIPLIGALFDKEIRKLAACLLLAFVLLFGTVQYLRYIAPLFVLAIPLALAVLQRHVPWRWLTGSLVALVAINVLLIPCANYMLRGDLLSLQLNSLLKQNSTETARIIVDRYAFEANIAKSLALSHPGKYSIYLADQDRPFTAPFAGQAFAPNWYDSDFQAAAAAADADASGRRWREIFARTGIRYVLAKNPTGSPSSLDRALSAGATKIQAYPSHSLFCFCSASDAKADMALYKARDLSRWLRLHKPTKGTEAMPRSPRTVVPGHSLLALDTQAPPLPSLVLEPPSASLCQPTSPPEPVLRWDTAGGSPAGVVIAYMMPGSVWQHWKVALPVGSAETGSWVRPGTMFAVLDNRKKKVLAQVAYGWTPCTEPAPP